MKKYFDHYIWAIVLSLLYFMDSSNEHFSFCLFRLVGFNHCIGCGIGHAIHDTLHFQFQKSFHEHIFGIPVTAILLYQVFKPFFIPKQNNLIWISNT